MELISLYYFTELAKTLHITKTAERLFITQQTLSSHIASLEKELGCTLFRRRPRFELTYAGRVFYSYACRFNNLYRSMQQEFRDIAGQEAGELSVGVAPTRGRFLLGPVLTSYRQAYPKVRLQLVEAANADLIARLLEDKVDLIIANLTEDNSLISSRPLFDEEIILLVPASLVSGENRARLAAGDLQPLADLPFLMNRQADIAGRIGNAFLDKNGILPHVAVTSENLETLLDLCYAGEGACFCPENLAARVFAGKDCSHLLPVSFGAAFSIRIAWLNKPYISKALLDFADVCLKHAGAGGKRLNIPYLSY